MISSPVPASDTRVRVHPIALATLRTIGVAPEHDHLARIRRQSLVGLGARGNDPGGYSTINEASLRTPPISVRGDLENGARLRVMERSGDRRLGTDVTTG